MAQIVIMPKLGQTVEESTVVKWHKQAGDKVAKGEILFEIETDKAVLEIESFFEGTLLKIIVPEGETVPVTAPVAFIGAPGEPLPELPPMPKKPVAEEASAPAARAAALVPGAAPAASAAPVRAAPRKKIISPRARRLLKEYPIDPDPIPGTGPEGRVTEKDVLAYLETAGYNRLRITPAARALALKEGIDVLSLDREGDERISLERIERAVAEKPREMSNIRQIIARRLTRSFTSVPHYYVTVSADITDLLALRKALKKAGKPYSITDFVMKSAALALRDFPDVNSTTDGRAIRWHSRVHLGMAAEVKEGLVVPVIRDADTISLDELHTRVMNLAQKAKTGKLMPDEMTGSTFTISNMGMLDVDNFTAIINPGESAILAVSSIRETPVVRKDQVVVRSMMNMSISADHRIVDGAMAARFINQIKSRLEDIELWKNMTSS